MPKFMPAAGLQKPIVRSLQATHCQGAHSFDVCYLQGAAPAWSASPGEVPVQQQWGQLVQRCIQLPGELNAQSCCIVTMRRALHTPLPRAACNATASSQQVNSLLTVQPTVGSGRGCLCTKPQVVDRLLCMLHHCRMLCLSKSSWGPTSPQQS